MKDLRTPNYMEIYESLPEKAELVYKAMVRHGPCTCSELAAKMEWPVTSIRPRICDLKNKYGLVEATTERRKGEYVFAWISVELAQHRALVADQFARETQFTLSSE